MVAVAQAQPPAEQPFSADGDVLLNLPYSMRLELRLSSRSGPSLWTPSAVFTPEYRSRALDERAQLETWFGIHLVDQPALRPYVLRQAPVRDHPQFNFVQGPLTGLQFERKDLLFHGDRLSIRATSDAQTLFRGAGLPSSELVVDFLSVLGWRSHSSLVWQLGEPARELQWRFSASIDRRATTVRNSTVELQVLRLF
jgi:hypothetical protein